jgi:hypothetical protein
MLILSQYFGWSSPLGGIAGNFKRSADDWKELTCIELNTLKDKCLQLDRIVRKIDRLVAKITIDCQLNSNFQEDMESHGVFLQELQSGITAELGSRACHQLSQVMEAAR